MDSRTVSHNIAIALAKIDFDSFHMVHEISGIIEDYQNEEIDSATLETRIDQSLIDSSLSESVKSAVLRHLVIEAIKDTL